MNDLTQSDYALIAAALKSYAASSPADSYDVSRLAALVAACETAIASYDPQTMAELAAAIESQWASLPRGRMEMAYRVFRGVFPWFGPEMVAAGIVDEPHGKKVAKVWAKAQAEWTRLTGLPRLSGMDILDGWRVAACAAGTLAAEFERLSWDEIVDLVTAYGRRRITS